MRTEWTPEQISPVEPIECRCVFCSFGRLERRIGTREAADHFAETLTPRGVRVFSRADIIRIVAEHPCAKSSEVASA